MDHLLIPIWKGPHKTGAVRSAADAQLLGGPLYSGGAGLPRELGTSKNLAVWSAM